MMRCHSNNSRHPTALDIHINSFTVDLTAKVCIHGRFAKISDAGRVVRHITVTLKNLTSEVAAI
ncbi:hypothetical protein E2C01_007605 [Portunus trituberculatus]|uniref:Uncharacterized protein n=1 Tax=Portunus trituberculatus TaxID=210409 RepID=A0A5B7CZP2_PORTR|nr:hypothetical protein [Portunus trituberculatus]